MKCFAKRDNRTGNDFMKLHDDAWNKVCREAGLNYRQSMIVAAYVKAENDRCIEETKETFHKGFFIAMIDVLHLGTNKRATRLTKVQNRCSEVINEAYGHTCIDANGRFVDYDGCGGEYLDSMLRARGVEV